jgi:hypothetical protein
MLQILPILGFFGLKEYHLGILAMSSLLHFENKNLPLKNALAWLLQRLHTVYVEAINEASWVAFQSLVQYLPGLF